MLQSQVYICFVILVSIIRDSTFASLEGSGGVVTSLCLRDEQLKLLLILYFFRALV